MMQTDQRRESSLERLSRGVGFRQGPMAQVAKRSERRQEIDLTITDVPGRTTMSEEPNGSMLVSGALVRSMGRPDDQETTILLPLVMSDYVAICFKESGSSVSARGHLCEGHWIISAVGPIETRRKRNRKA